MVTKDVPPYAVVGGNWLPLLSIVFPEPDIERLREAAGSLSIRRKRHLLNLQPLLLQPGILALEQAVAQHRQDRA